MHFKHRICELNLEALHQFGIANYFVDIVPYRSYCEPTKVESGLMQRRYLKIPSFFPANEVVITYQFLK